MTASNSNSKRILEIIDLHVKVEDKEILKGVNLTINACEVHAIMGRNGSGKSTLSYTVMGHPRYKVTGGQMLYKGQEISEMSPDERCKLGISLAFQYPVAISGVSVSNFLRKITNSKRGKEIPVKEFRQELKAAMAKLGVKDEFLSRYVNDGFSGGEKKRNEILQMAMLEPRLGLLDETDSGLDIDALKIVSEGVNRLRSKERAFVLVTHYQRLLDYIQPDFVHVLMDGKIVKSGDKTLALELESKGYDWIREANR